jgi:hypothetical protein
VEPSLWATPFLRGGRAGRCGGMADAGHSKCSVARRVGSSPTTGTGMARVILSVAGADRQDPRTARSVGPRGRGGGDSTCLERAASGEPGGPRFGWRVPPPARRSRLPPATRRAPRAAPFPTSAPTHRDTGGTTCPPMSPEGRTSGVRRRNPWSAPDRPGWPKPPRPRAGHALQRCHGHDAHGCGGTGRGVGSVHHGTGRSTKRYERDATTTVSTSDSATTSQ